MQGQDLAVFTVESKWTPNKPLEAKHCYGTTSIEHPAVSMITTERGKYYLGARLARGEIRWCLRERTTVWDAACVVAHTAGE